MKSKHIKLIAPLALGLSVGGYFLLNQADDDGRVVVLSKDASHAGNLNSLEGFADWLAELVEENGELSEQEIQLGLEQVLLRKEKFLKLMQEQPKLAMQSACPRSVRARLPKEMQQHVEQRRTETAHFGISWETAVGEEHSCSGQSVLEIGNKRWDVVYTEPTHVGDPIGNVPVQAVTLGNTAVVSAEFVEVLESAEEITYAKAHFSMAPTGNADPVSGEVVENGVTALLNGEVYVFESEKNLQRVESELKKSLAKQRAQRVAVADFGYPWLTDASGGGGDNGGLEATPYLTNNINVLFVRVDFDDMPGEPIKKTDLESTLNSAGARILENSYNQASVNYTVSDTVYRVDYANAEHYATTDDMYGMQLDVTTLLRNEGTYTVGDYDVIGIYFADMSGISGSVVNYAGKGSIGAVTSVFYETGIWINGVNNTQVLAHELGHNFGARHANYWDETKSLSGSYSGNSLEYGDIFDVMGKGSGLEAHMNPYTKNRLEWIPDSKVTDVSADGTYRVYRFDAASAIGSPSLAMKVTAGEGVNYWVGLRESIDDARYNLQGAAYVVAEGFHGDDESDLVDMTPGSGATETLDRQDSALEVGGTFYDAERGVRLTTMAAGGDAPAQWIDVQVEFDSRIAIDNTTLEVDEHKGYITVEASRSISSEGVVVVSYTTNDGTATGGSDFYDVSGILTWADGDSTTQIITIPIRPDNLAEGVENFTLNLSMVSGGVLDQESKTATIKLLEAGDAYDFISELGGGWLSNIAHTEDGKIYAVGDFDGFGETGNISGVVRFNADGSIDNSFTSVTGFNRQKANDVVILDDDRVVVVGEFTEYNGVTCNRIVCINSDGSLDTEFNANIGTGANDSIYSVILESSGTLLVGGKFTMFNGNSTEKIVRLNQNGTASTAKVDLYFNILSAGYVGSIEERESGCLLLGGYQMYKTGTVRQSGIFSINSDGSRDTSFAITRGAAGTSENNSISTVHSVTEVANGQIYIGGNFYYYNDVAIAKLARLNADSTIDTSFIPPTFDYSPGGGVLINSIYPQVDGKVIIGGRFDSPKNHIVRLNSDGSVDETFDPGTGFDRSITAIAEDANGALWVSGIQFHYDGVDQNDLTKIAPGVSEYDRWAIKQFSAAQVAVGLAAADADADGDGVPNAAEKALGTSPVEANTVSAFRVDAENLEVIEEGGNNYLQATIEKGSEAQGVWYAAQFSSDLVTWEPMTPTPVDFTAYDVITDSSSTFTVRDKTPMVSTEKRFARILILQPN